jgi:hypothetical protein
VCRGKDPNWFVAPPDTNRRPSKALTEFYERAERICAVCPVFEQCREYAFTNIPASDNGIYAGMSPSRRKREGIVWRRQRTAVVA